MAPIAPIALSLFRRPRMPFMTPTTDRLRPPRGSSPAAAARSAPPATSWSSRWTASICAGTLAPDAAPADRTAYRLHATFIASTSRFGVGQLRDTHRTRLAFIASAPSSAPDGPSERVPVPPPLRLVSGPADPTRTSLTGFSGSKDWNRDSTAGATSIPGPALSTSTAWLTNLLGRPASRGCIHLAATDLMFL
jgi:hypothetical protein